VKDHRTTRALAAAALALTLGACSDVPTSPAARVFAADQPARTTSSSGATLIANTVKYRDNGGKPATGRSGSAALEAFALLGKYGQTDLEFGPVAADPSQGWVRGIMTHAKVKALDAEGRLMFQYNVNNLDAERQQTQVGSLARGQALQVQANVTGIDPHRTDVVTVTERVKLRPDLAVWVAMAAEVPAMQPVPIFATVAELNGDVGAHANCSLIVDGRTVDWSYGVWVDAGDAVSCAFSQAFPPGAHNVYVHVTGVEPGDWDEANNTSEAVRVQAVGGPISFYYEAFAVSRSWREVSRTENRWTNTVSQTSAHTIREHSADEFTEYASMSGWINLLVAGEMEVEVSQTTGGRVVHADRWTDWGGGCSTRWAETAAFFMCSMDFGPGSPTWFTYVHDGGTVTYHGSVYQRIWHDGTGEEIYYYHENYSDSWNLGPTVGFGDDYAFHVRVTAGDVVLTGDSEFALTHSAFADRGSYCYGDDGEWEGFTSLTCTTYDIETGESIGWDAQGH
jgi:hypothetical protein